MPASAMTEKIAALNAYAIAMGWGTRCYEELDFAHPELNALRDVWMAKEREVGWPSRADLDPRLLKPFLSHISIQERVAEPSGIVRYRMRLTGTEVAAMFGEQTGRFLDEFIPESYLPRWSMSNETTLAGRQPLRFVSRFQTPKVDWLDGESFSAPLSNGNVPPTMIFSATYFTPKVRTGPD